MNIILIFSIKKNEKFLIIFQTFLHNTYFSNFS